MAIGRTNTSSGEPRKIAFRNVVVSPSDWVLDNTYEKYPNKATVNLASVTDRMTAEVIFGINEAVEGVYAPVNETFSGGLYLYASVIPNAAITIPQILVWR